MKTQTTRSILDRLPVSCLDGTMKHQTRLAKLERVKPSALNKVLSDKAKMLISKPNSSFHSMERVDQDTYMKSISHMLDSIKNRRIDARYDESNDEVIQLCLALWYGYHKGYLLKSHLPPEAEDHNKPDVVLFTQEVERFMNEFNIIRFYNCHIVAVDSFLERSNPIYPGYYSKEELLLSLWYLAMHSGVQLSAIINYSLPNTRHISGTPLEELMCKYLYV